MQTSYGKWTKYVLMKKVDIISSHLPETKLFSEKSLWMFIDKYNEIVFKPCRGDHGIGVILLTSLGSDRYELQELNNKIIITGKVQTFKYLNEKVQKKRNYILQQRIHFAEVQGSPFDLRVIVQRKKSTSLWEVTGVIARAALNGFFITNIVVDLFTAEQAIAASGLDIRPANDVLNEINNIALATSTHLEKYYGKYTTISVDMALDKCGKLWIIEVNLNPSIAIFNLLEDKSVYKRILKNMKR
jgi:hypothetical protein